MRVNERLPAAKSIHPDARTLQRRLSSVFLIGCGVNCVTPLASSWAHTRLCFPVTPSDVLTGAETRQPFASFRIITVRAKHLIERPQSSTETVQTPGP
jgi:hypothetical protein